MSPYSPALRSLRVLQYLRAEFSSTQAITCAGFSEGGREMPCRPYGYDTVRCYRKHAENDPMIGQPIKPKKLGRRVAEDAAEDAAEAAERKPSPGLEPKTVVNSHRMLDRAWEDFATWGWPNGTSSATRALPACSGRAGRCDGSLSFNDFCSMRGLTGSSRYGCSKPPRACAAASRRAPAATCSTWTAERS